MKRSNIKALVITGFGLNCEKETAAACTLVGMRPELVHLNDLIAGKHKLEEYDFLAFIGGFSFGDHLGSGTIFANRVKFQLRGQLEKFVADGKLVIGICNGFQTLSRLGMVPALDGQKFEQDIALAHNDSGVFRDDWCVLKADPASPCVFTRNIDTVRLPLRHGEGKFVAAPEMLERIEKLHLAAVRYVDADGK
ncbi:MAG: phosphoribosylformylglycinamidine synthase subunit PurQ, partial [Victivallaceae bacterium]|nr:phosphoribosylformylglycinamidine synthase subunit PurQ [Victivallaceae bacterium]